MAHEIDLVTGWCSVHDTDCGPQLDFEALDYVPDVDDPDAYPYAGGPVQPGRVPDEVRRPADAHSFDLADGWCHAHRQFCSVAAAG